jgi:hypothetical protein
VLQAAKSEGRGYDDTEDQRKKKKIAALHYKRRKLEKNVKEHIKLNDPIRSRQIEAIGNRHGFYIE